MSIIDTMHEASSLSIRGELDRIHLFVKVEVVQDHCTSKIHKEGSPVYTQEVKTHQQKDKHWDGPSSTLIKTLESGLSAMTAMFLRFSKERVYDLFLEYKFRETSGFKGLCALTQRGRTPKPDSRLD